MTRSPFAPLSAPSQIFHAEQYSLLTAHLASATKQADCLMLVCGADGAGKTTLLNRYIASLSDEISFATFDDTCADGTDFYCAFLRQLGFHEITGTLQELRRITREFLIHRGKARDPVLLILDNAHLVSPTVLEQLRWIAETRVDERRVLSVVLAGNSDLLRIMTSPAMKLMTFGSHIDFNIRIFTEEETEDYVRHRLRLAGGAEAAKFSSEAHPLIYRFSGGVPGVINTLCDAVMTEACGRETRVISAELVRVVADKQHLQPTVISFKGKGRRKTDRDFLPDTSQQKKEERIAARATPDSATADVSGHDTALHTADAEVLKGHIARLRAQVLALKAENQQLQFDLGVYTRDVEGLHKQLSRKTSENEKLSAAANEVTEVRQQLKAKTQEVRVLGKAVEEIDELRNALDAKTSAADEGAEAAARLKELQEQLDAKTQHTEELGKTVAEMNDLRDALDAVRLENASLKEAATEADSLEGQLKKTTHELEALRIAAAELDDLKEQLATAPKETGETISVTGQVAELQKQLDKQATENRELNEKIDKDIEKIQELEDFVADRTNSLLESEKTVKALSGDLKKEQSAARKAMASADRATKRLEKLTATRKELQQSVRKLTADLKRASKQTKNDQQRDKELQTLKKKLKDKEELVSFGDKLVNRLENSLQESRDECELLRADDSAKKAALDSLAEKDARIALLEKEIGSYDHLMATTQVPSSEIDDGNEAAPDYAEAAADDVRCAISRIEIVRAEGVADVVAIDDLPARIMIGRGDDCDLHLNSKFVSRHHALIFREGNAVYIEDLNSFNGTLVNYKKILRCELHPDDKVVVGDYELKPF